jgi:hypothetical protein
MPTMIGRPALLLLNSGLFQWVVHPTATTSGR